MANYYTKMPNWFFNRIFKDDLTGGEVKTLLFIARMTWGFQKGSDKLSSSFIAAKTGLSIPTVKRAILSLEKQNYIKIKRKKKKGSFFETNEIFLNGSITDDTSLGIIDDTGGSITDDQNSVSQMIQYPLKGKERPISDGGLKAPSLWEEKNIYALDEDDEYE